MLIGSTTMPGSDFFDQCLEQGCSLLHKAAARRPDKGPLMLSSRVKLRDRVSTWG